MRRYSPVSRASHNNHDQGKILYAPEPCGSAFSGICQQCGQRRWHAFPSQRQNPGTHGSDYSSAMVKGEQSKVAHSPTTRERSLISTSSSDHFPNNLTGVADSAISFNTYLAGVLWLVDRKAKSRFRGASYPDLGHLAIAPHCQVTGSGAVQHLRSSKSSAQRTQQHQIGHTSHLLRRLSCVASFDLTNHNLITKQVLLNYGSSCPSALS